MDIKTVNRKILYKFGSMANFARMVGMRTLVGKTPTELNRIVQELDKGNGVELSEARLKRLREAILKAGGVYAFCQKTKGFSKVTIFQILSGRRKRMGQVVRRLFDHFGV